MLTGWSLRRRAARTLPQTRLQAERARLVVSTRFGGLPARDAWLLLPWLPGTGTVLGDVGRWARALAHWGVAEAPVASAELVVGRPAEVLSHGRRPPLVLAPGADRLGRLRRAGYSITTHRVRWLTWEVVAAAPDRCGLALARRTWTLGSHGRENVRDVVVRSLRPRSLTVAVRGEGAHAPAALAAAGVPGVEGSLAVDIRDDRRRAVFLIADPGRRATRAVVKVVRTPAIEDRASHEQRILSLLPPDRVTPRPLGAGRLGPVAWSAETVVSGQPLNQVLLRRRAPTLRVLGHLAEWLQEVAVRTVAPADWKAAAADDDDAIVALRGRAAELRPLLRNLCGVPTVLTHGDLASGHNVLVDGSGCPAVLDWETAREHGLPLLDVVPLLCWSLARARGARGPHHEAAHVLDLATGQGPDSDWLFGQVARYAHGLALPPNTIGPLALLAWGHQASMRLVRDELLAASGLPVRPWTSVGELVLDTWRYEVGQDWAGPLGALR